MAKMVYYTGDVQGVGFRATAAHIARGRPVRGWVKSLPDGRVQRLADGDASEVEAFLAAVRNRMARHIENEDVFEREPDDPVEGFRIVY